jgi:hypothetical protein
MSVQKPPPWGDDPLSRFFADADFNNRVTALNFGPVYTVLRRVDELFRRSEEASEKDHYEHLLVSRLLMVRAHASVLAGLRLAMSGQTTESYPVLHAAVELSWYALHIAKDPSPSRRAVIWLNRNENDTDKTTCKAEFTIANVRRTHESSDADTAKTMQQLYEHLIDFGAHPNQLGVMTPMSKMETEKQVNFSVGILYPERMVVVFALRMAVGVAISALKTFELIFPERFRLLRIDQALNSLVAEANQAFKSHSPK